MMSDDLTPPHWGELPYSATGDVIETIARALRLMHQDAMDGVALRDIHTRDIATALLAQIAPALRAEGMERAARIVDNSSDDYCYIEDCGEINIGLDRHEVCTAIRAEAARLRGGGEG
jgi:hypothetical protein